jgi:hypothetical protein
VIFPAGFYSNGNALAWRIPDAGAVDFLGFSFLDTVNTVYAMSPQEAWFGLNGGAVYRYRGDAGMDVVIDTDAGLGAVQSIFATPTRVWVVYYTANARSDVRAFCP